MIYLRRGLLSVSGYNLKLLATPDSLFFLMSENYKNLKRLPRHNIFLLPIRKIIREPFQVLTEIIERYSKNY
jgi:hypothetical protein